MPTELKAVIITGCFVIVGVAWGAVLPGLVGHLSRKQKAAIVAFSVVALACVMLVMLLGVPGEGEGGSSGSDAELTATATPASADTSSPELTPIVATAVASATVALTPTPTPTLTPTPTPTPTPVFRPTLSVEEPVDMSVVAGTFRVRGKSTDLAGEKIYLVTRDLWEYPEQCEAPVCPRYWMHDEVSVKSSGDFLGTALACWPGGHYEVLLLYGVTDAGQRTLRDWLWDRHSRARAELPTEEDVIVVGNNLEVIADLSREPVPAGCSARGAGD